MTDVNAYEERVYKAARDHGEAPLATYEPKTLATWTPSFAVAVDEAIVRKREKNRFFQEVMDKDLHYGVIPGAGTKPTLLKPGAEMLLANMGLNPELSDAETPIIDVTGAEHGGEPYIRYRRVCRIYRQIGMTENERVKIAQAEGSCSSWETKYRYRNDKLKCPECAKPTIIKQKDFSGQNRDLGWICWKKEQKSDGCGEKFPAGDPRIAGQSVGKIANPDVAEIENTILKMADKRALVAATLLATGCSDIFTQDVEDYAPEPASEAVPGLQDVSPAESVRVPDIEIKALWEAAGRPDGRILDWLAREFGYKRGTLLPVADSIAAAGRLRALAEGAAKHGGGEADVERPGNPRTISRPDATGAVDVAQSPPPTAARIRLYAYRALQQDDDYRELMRRHYGCSTSRALDEQQVTAFADILRDYATPEQVSEIEYAHKEALLAWQERQNAIA